MAGSRSPPHPAWRAATTTSEWVWVPGSEAKPGILSMVGPWDRSVHRPECQPLATTNREGSV